VTSAAPCTFCAIVAGDAPAERVTETEHALAFVNANPANPGHMLVIPKRHSRDIWELPREDGVEVWRLVEDMADLAKRVYEPDGLNLFQANGVAGWQSEFHFHIHVVPRWVGDALVPPWPHLHGDPQEVAEMGSRLRAALKDRTP
jgi:histidine triad (HIT) family protein